MTIGDMPTIHDAAHSHSTYSLGNLAAPVRNTMATTNTASFVTSGLAAGNLPMPSQAALVLQAAQQAQRQQPKPKQEVSIVSRRFVQVFIADPDDNVPLEKSMLYTGSQKLTDATDQELFFEIDMKAILDTYNTERVKIINKKVKERTEFLEPVKIRDLRMVVVNVATF